MKSSIVIGCIYKHPGMNFTEFNEFYQKNLFDELWKENQTVFLLRDLNIIPLNYNQDTSTEELHDSLYSHLTLRRNSKILINNTFSNKISPIVYLLLSLCLSRITYCNLSKHLTFFFAPKASNLTYMKESGLNLTKKTLSLINF